jgi:hypothetical protein
MSDEELKQLIASNAKAIQALNVSITELKNEWQKDREEWKKDRNSLYKFYDFYNRCSVIDKSGIFLFTSHQLKILLSYLPVN